MTHQVYENGVRVPQVEFQYPDDEEEESSSSEFDAPAFDRTAAAFDVLLNVRLQSSGWPARLAAWQVIRKSWTIQKALCHFGVSRRSFERARKVLRRQIDIARKTGSIPNVDNDLDA